MAKDDKNTAIYLGFEECLPFDTALPERNLLRAILLTAMSDLKRQGESRREAAEFFMSEDENYVFSFVSICNHLDIDPKRILTVTGLSMSVTEQKTEPTHSIISEVLDACYIEEAERNGTN